MDVNDIIVKEFCVNCGFYNNNKKCSSPYSSCPHKEEISKGGHESYMEFLNQNGKASQGND